MDPRHKAWETDESSPKPRYISLMTKPLIPPSPSDDFYAQAAAEPPLPDAGDPFVLFGAVAVMILIGLTATWIPARRALSVNPAQLLREE